MMDENDKRRFSVTLTKLYVGDLDRYVEEGFYIDHQAAIREALRRLSRFHGFGTFSDKEIKASNSRIEAVKKLHDEFKNTPTYGRMTRKLGKILEVEG